MTTTVLPLLFLALVHSVHADGRETIALWPGEVPGEQDPKAPPVLSDRRAGNTTRIRTITDPVLTVHEADPGHANGAAVIICPGGGYNILAIDKEGYEIADWLNGLGYTAFVLHYRVPRKQEGALQDAMRAVRCVRGMRSRWNLDTHTIGLLGFSAGGSLAARAATRYPEDLYEPVDEFDALSARPDFAVLIYPAYLDKGPGETLTPELDMNNDAPPMFLFVAADDKHANSSLVMASALRRHKVPVELHVLPEGGHGFGMRNGNPAAEMWPSLCETWLQRTVFDKE